MSLGAGHVVLPRPGKQPSSPKPAIPGPSETVFTDAFGSLLPPAKYVTTANGRAAYYEIAPTAEGRNSSRSPDRVLLVHGVQTPALGLLPLTRALHACFPNAHMVLIDLWGHGLSDTPVLAHEASLFLELLDALLGHLQWSTAHLVGFSFGGYLTVRYAASRPSRVQSLITIAPAGLIRFTDQERQLLRDGDDAAAREWILDWLEGGELVMPPDWRQRVQRGEVVAEAVRDWQMRRHAGHAASVVAIVRDAELSGMQDVFARVARTQIPVMAVLGELDGVVTSQELHELGFANVVVIQQAGHDLVRQRVAEVAAAIEAFWRNVV